MIKTVISQSKFPAISIIVPTHPQYPGYKFDREYLKVLIHRIEKQLSVQYSKKKAELLIEKLNTITNRIDFTKLSLSLAIYVSTDVEKIIHLPFSVSSEKVIVDESFEIRDLIYAIKMNRNYLLVLINQNNVKTYLGYDSSISLVSFPEMPDNVKDVTNEHSLPGWNYFDTKAWNEKNLHNYLLFIDNVIVKETKNSIDEIILMGDKKLLGYYKKHTKIKNKIIGCVEGNYEHSTKSELLKIIHPILIKENIKEEEYALNLLNDAMKTGRCSSGISEVWRSAVEGRGRLLIVEKDYRQAARYGSDPFTIVVDEEKSNPWNHISDAVDDVLELILNNKGDVVFVENGNLKDHEKIVLINRY